MAADTADGADGVVGSVLAHGRYPDCPRSQPPLAAEDNLNPERAERGLCPTQPASECAGTLRPARPGPSGHSIAVNIDADLQKVGCASRPLRSVGHELADTGRYRVGVDDVLDRVAPVVRISGFKGALGVKSRFAGCDPEREIRIEERAKNVRSGELRTPAISAVFGFISVAAASTSRNHQQTYKPLWNRLVPPDNRAKYSGRTAKLRPKIRGVDSATTDVILKRKNNRGRFQHNRKRFPLLFSPCCPAYHAAQLNVTALKVMGGWSLAPILEEPSHGCVEGYI
jgi:hypothetical protein